MSASKAEMYGSYLALFCFASVMILIQLLFDSKVGPVLWGLVAWQIYQRNRSTLIITLRFLFWLVIVGGTGSVIWFALGPANTHLNRFVEGEGIGLAIAAGLFWWMRVYFEKSLTAADIFSDSLAGSPAPAGAGIAAVESAFPEEPQPESMLTRVLVRAKQVRPWRRRPAQPAHGGDAPGTANAARFDYEPSTLADKGRPPEAAAESAKATQNAAWVATKTMATAPPSHALPKSVAGSPGIKAEPSDFRKTIPPENHSAIPLSTVVEEERIYARIAEELETGGIDKGLWTRLFAECDGDERRTKVLYIRQRAARLLSAERGKACNPGAPPARIPASSEV